jgi:mRNA interferase MazF
MPSSISIGDIFLFRVDFQDDPETSKERPVVVLSISDEEVVVTVAQITSVGPNIENPTYHDQFKFPILNWEKSGLDRSSWIKIYPDNILIIEISALNNHKGHLHSNDLKRLLDILISADIF